MVVTLAICDLPDMYALSPRACGPQALGIHIRQIPHGHVTTITNLINIRQIPHGHVTTITNLIIYSYTLYTHIEAGTHMHVEAYAHTVQHKTLVGENLGRFGTVRKLAEKILAADHTNNNSLFELTTFGR